MAQLLGHLPVGSAGIVHEQGDAVDRLARSHHHV